MNVMVVLVFDFLLPDEPTYFAVLQICYVPVVVVVNKLWSLADKSERLKWQQHLIGQISP